VPAQHVEVTNGELLMLLWSEQSMPISDRQQISSCNSFGRLTSLLWRLRRATAIESGLLAFDAKSCAAQKEADVGNRLAVFLKIFRVPPVRTCGGRSKMDKPSSGSAVTRAACGAKSRRSFSCSTQ